ncbi:gpi anchored serine-threonine rich [Fusarium longipes]|uniref:Gpi anchored serine-threonine rich n=1 Tax=Fusarium longipes TaxID=694270 RepID=A0A395S3V6_9HYPO|nr:gpi anchored serine-threonine rich [Fusarium longipes]
MNKFLIIALSTSGAIASMQYSPSFPLLSVRQVVEVPCSEQNLKDCGTGCIQQDWTCCPSQKGGCPPTAYCDVGTNAQYGCCPNGSVCNGEGGGSTRGSTDTLTLVGGDTTTVVQPGASQAETSAPVLEGSSTAVIVPPADTSVPPILPVPSDSAVPLPVPVPETPGVPVVPVPTPSSVIVNGGSSNRYSLFGGIVAGVAAIVL